MFEELACVDGGNVVFPPFDAASVRGAVEAAVAAVLGSGAAPFLVGGDHSIATSHLAAHVLLEALALAALARR